MIFTGVSDLSHRQPNNIDYKSICKPGTVILMNYCDEDEPMDDSPFSWTASKAENFPHSKAAVLVNLADTADALEQAGLGVRRVNKVQEGRPHIVDMIKNDEADLIVNTTEGRQSHKDSYSIRRTALELKIPCYTTASAAEAAVKSLKKIDAGALEPRSLQSYSRGD